MGIYTEYLDKGLSFQQLTDERKKQLRRISKIRGRDVLVFAADLNKNIPLISIGYPDLLPIADQLANLKGKALDLILETPGGSGEVAEDIVRLLRSKYDDIAVIIPGWAKSAGAIMAMAGDDILMEPASALGPIDAQMVWQAKIFSAHALLEGFEKIKDEVKNTGTLNKAYIPILQAISPGELQSAQNALDFAKALVTQWLVRYKFKNWEKHASTGEPVTNQQKEERAAEIADELCDHGRWLTHARSIKLDDLEKMRVRITDYSKNPELTDAIRRYHTLLQMTFVTNIYKVFETPDSQIYRFQGVVAQPAAPAQQANAVAFDVPCPNCKKIHKIQANLGAQHPLQPGCTPFPADNKLVCECGAVTDLSEARRQIEVQSKKTVVT